MPAEINFIYDLLARMNSIRHEWRTNPTILGGTSGSGGGYGSPIGGYIGILPQTNVAGDTTEPAQWTSGSPSSLYDNLSRIRYWGLPAHQFQIDQNDPVDAYYHISSGSWTYTDATPPLIFHGGNAPAITPPVSGIRYDLLKIDRYGNLSWTQGTNVAPPNPPSTTSGSMALWTVVAQSSGSACRFYNDGVSHYVWQDYRPFIDFGLGGSGGVSSGSTPQVYQWYLDGALAIDSNVAGVYYVPFDFTPTLAEAYLRQPASSGSTTIDILYSSDYVTWSSLFLNSSNRVTIPSSGSYATHTTISHTLHAGDILRLDITQAGTLSSTLSVNLVGNMVGGGSGGTGSVSSVALSLPSTFSVTGSPVTTSGTLAATFAQTPANGSLLIGNGTDYVSNHLVAGSNISISNSSGSVTISASSSTLNVNDGSTSVNNVSSIVFDQVTNLGGGAVYATSGSDFFAIHRNVADEIHTVTAKTTLANNDVFIIEDSEDSWSKKRVPFSSLGISSGSGTSIKSFFAPSDFSDTLGDTMPYGAVTESRSGFVVPDDFSSNLTITLVFIAYVGAGNFYIESVVYYSGNGGGYSDNTNSVAQTFAVNNLGRNYYDTFTLSSAVIGQTVNLVVRRDATVPQDTVLADMTYMGAIVSYTATTGGGTGTTGKMEIGITGGGSTPSTGVLLDLVVPYGLVITGWEMIADQTGSIQVDLWKDTYANFPPTLADTVTGSDKPKIVSGFKNTSSALTGWTTTWSSGDVVRVNIDSVSTITRATLVLSYTRS